MSVQPAAALTAPELRFLAELRTRGVWGLNESLPEDVDARKLHPYFLHARDHPLITLSAEGHRVLAEQGDVPAHGAIQPRVSVILQGCLERGLLNALSRVSRIYGKLDGGEQVEGAADLVIQELTAEECSLKKAAGEISMQIEEFFRIPD